MRPALLYVLQAYIKEQRWLDQVFDKYDTNKSGQLEKGQLIELLRRDNPTPTLPLPLPLPLALTLAQAQALALARANPNPNPNQARLPRGGGERGGRGLRTRHGRPEPYGHHPALRGPRRVRHLEERARLGQRAEPEILLVLSAIMRARARGDDGM